MKKTTVILLTLAALGASAIERSDRGWMLPTSWLPGGTCAIRQAHRGGQRKAAVATIGIQQHRRGGRARTHERPRTPVGRGRQHEPLHRPPVPRG